MSTGDTLTIPLAKVLAIQALVRAVYGEGRFEAYRAGWEARRAELLRKQAHWQRNAAGR